MTPTVSVIVTSHLDSCRPYLDVCLWALMHTQGAEFETLVIASSETAPERKAAPWAVIHDRSLDSGAKKWKHGAAVAHPKSEYFLFLSDDVMLSTWALCEMVKAAKKTGGIVSPFAQAEHVSGRFIMDPPRLSKSSGPGFEMLTLTPDMSLDDVKGWSPYIIGRDPGPPIIAIQPWVPFYAPLIPRAVWEKVGELDPALDSRHNDEDYCYRAARLGIPSAFCLSAPVLHFGSKTISQVYTREQMDQATHQFLLKQAQANPMNDF